MDKYDELETAFDKMIEAEAGPAQQNFGDEGIRAAIASLGKPIMRLDRTSSRLARINIWLAVVLAVIGALQVYLMVVK
jgi:hypothetical protein